jgi:hypothetical protein
MNTTRFVLIMLCTSGALALVHSTAYAADPAESAVEANALTAKAAALYDEGVSAYKKGQWAAARASFLAAWSLKKHWQIAANLADTEVELGKYRDAAEHAFYYLGNGPADRHARAQALLDKAQARTGTLTVRVDRAGADVLVDGEVVGKSPLVAPVFVDPGHHTVAARLGAGVATSPADVLAGAPRDVALTLKEPQAPPIVPAREGPSVPVIVTGASVTGVGIVVGAILAVLAHREALDANAKLATLPPPAGVSPCATLTSTCDAINSERHTSDALSNASVGTFIGGGVVGLATLGYALLAPKAPAASGMRVLPAVGSGQAGVVVMGAW